ncbi:MAG: acyl-CoA dehydratase activase [Atopobiaceae bacterium]
MESFIGVDIGSTAAKVVVLGRNEEIAGRLLLPTGFSSVDTAGRIRDLLAKKDLDVEDPDVKVVATGYGRIAVPYANKSVTEITCHGKGAARLFDENGTVIDVGGQDTKVISLSHGRVTKFLMNDKCAAGTGRFLEVMANRLGVSQEELSRLAATGQPTKITSMCTVFAESEVISLVGKGEPRENIANGVIESVVGRVSSLAAQGSGAPYFLTGGLCENAYIVSQLSKHLQSPVTTCPDARYAGAIGAALVARTL